MYTHIHHRYVQRDINKSQDWCITKESNSVKKDLSAFCDIKLYYCFGCWVNLMYCGNFTMFKMHCRWKFTSPIMNNNTKHAEMFMILMIFSLKQIYVWSGHIQCTTILLQCTTMISVLIPVNIAACLRLKIILYVIQWILVCNVCNTWQL